MKHKQAGFTLIELIVVFVILGILAATAIPKFSSVSDSARSAVADGIVGSVLSSAVIQYGANSGNPVTFQTVWTNLDCDVGTDTLEIDLDGAASFTTPTGGCGGTTTETCTGGSANTIDVKVGGLQGTRQGTIPAGLCSG